MVIVDNSVWSLALRRRQPAADATTAELVRLIETGEAFIAGPIRQELLSGIAAATQFESLRARLEAFADVPIHTADYESAAACFNACRVRGVQGSNTDYLICALALRLSLPVFSVARDFGRYAGILGVPLHTVAV